MNINHEKFMSEAINEARNAQANNEVPIGAVIVDNGKIIARGFNSVISKSDPSSHAEISAIRKACEIKKNYRLPSCELYVTLEPCIMCLGAIFHARIKGLYFGAYDEKFGSCSKHQNLVNNKIINHHTFIQGGILEIECQKVLRVFFKDKR